MAELRYQSAPPGTDTGNARDKCCIYERVPLQDSGGTTRLYYMVLSPGHTLAGEPMSKAQLPNLLTKVLPTPTMELFAPRGKERVFIPSPLSQMWLRKPIRYDPKKIVLRLPDSCKLEEGDAKAMLELKKMGMQFAAQVGVLGDLSHDPSLIAALDYILVDNHERQGLMTALNGLKQQNPNLKAVGFKAYGELFTREEASKYDLVLGMVEPIRLPYEARPAWQHVLLRTFAELFSGIYDLKDLGKLAGEYPIFGAAMKGLLSSKEVTELTIHSGGMMLSNVNKLTQKDMRDLLSVALGYCLLCLADKYTRPAEAGEYNPLSTDLEMLLHGIIRGKMVEILAEKPCDDYDNRQAFMSGFLSLIHLYIHDKYAAVCDEFMLNAPASYFAFDNTTLGRVIRYVRALEQHDFETVNEISGKSGFGFTKEQVYAAYLRAVTWADALIKAIIDASSQAFGKR
ncbi:MAG: hypothetical protein IJ228_01155 [Succinivibrio sp.]|nr:hypothetical protein [Succinivibrio sp.]